MCHNLPRGGHENGANRAALRALPASSRRTFLTGRQGLSPRGLALGGSDSRRGGTWPGAVGERKGTTATIPHFRRKSPACNRRQPAAACRGPAAARDRHGRVSSSSARAARSRPRPQPDRARPRGRVPAPGAGWPARRRGAARPDRGLARVARAVRVLRRHDRAPRGSGRRSGPDVRASPRTHASRQRRRVEHTPAAIATIRDGILVRMRFSSSATSPAPTLAAAHPPRLPHRGL